MFSYISKLLRKRKPMIVAIGDVHGKIPQLIERIEEFNLTGIDYVQVGDFGIGFDSPIRESKKLKELDILLQYKESRMWIIRGNHDNPMYWDPDFSYDLSNIVLVKDNTCIDIKGKSCFFAGGSLSIDRKNRMKGVSYWPRESYYWEEPKNTPKTIDYLFTHDVYHHCSPFRIESPIVQRRFMSDPDLRGDLIENQIQMKKLYEFVTTANKEFSWYHGHYHESHFTSIENQKTYSLAELEFREVI